MLRQSEQHGRNWNYGNAIHEGNSVLGRIALAAGDVETARKHLLAAGQLNSFGPDLTLANELLKKGEREAVAKYLKDVSRFWDMERDRLKSWIDSIEAGDTLDLLSPKYSGVVEGGA